MTFFIAMQSRRATASYLHPQTIISERNEFLIVSRSGGQNEFLSISNAGASTGQETEAPPELDSNLVFLATLVSQGPDRAEVFLIEEDLPQGLDPPNRFVGGDGYVVLQQCSNTVMMRGAIRLRPGPKTRLVAPQCLLLRAEEPGATVHFDASYIPWTRELLPGDFGLGEFPDAGSIQ